MHCTRQCRPVIVLAQGTDLLISYREEKKWLQPTTTTTTTTGSSVMANSALAVSFAFEASLIGHQHHRLVLLWWELYWPISRHRSPSKTKGRAQHRSQSVSSTVDANQLASEQCLALVLSNAELLLNCLMWFLHTELKQWTSAQSEKELADRYCRRSWLPCQSVCLSLLSLVIDWIRKVN